MRNQIQVIDGQYYILNPVDHRENFADKWEITPRKKDIFFDWLDSVVADTGSGLVFLSGANSWQPDPCVGGSVGFYCGESIARAIDLNCCSNAVPSHADDFFLFSTVYFDLGVYVSFRWHACCCSECRGVSAAHTFQSIDPRHYTKGRRHHFDAG